MGLPSAVTMFTGAATTGAGIGIMTGESVPTGELLSDSFAGNDSDGDGSPPPPHQTVPQEYLLTPRAIQAIVKSWNITAYNPPRTTAAGWLARVHNRCEVYRVPIKQRALCAMQYMRADCRKAARAARCYDMTWDQFTIWLRQYDGMCLQGSLPRAETFTRRDYNERKQ